MRLSNGVCIFRRHTGILQFPWIELDIFSKGRTFRFFVVAKRTRHYFTRQTPNLSLIWVKEWNFCKTEKTWNFELVRRCASWHTFYMINICSAHYGMRFCRYRFIIRKVRLGISFDHLPDFHYSLHSNQSVPPPPTLRFYSLLRPLLITFYHCRRFFLSPEKYYFIRSTIIEE